jgi:hypothetical protein
MFVRVAVLLAFGCGRGEVSGERPVSGESPVASEPAPVAFVCPEVHEAVELEACPLGDARGAVAVFERAIVMQPSAAELSSAFAGDARWTFARRERREPSDVELAPAVAREVVALTDDSPDEIGFSRLEGRASSSRVELRADVVFYLGVGQHTWDRNAYEVVLVRDGGWKVASIREWPLDWAAFDENEAFSDESWDRADREVERAAAAFRANESEENARAFVQALSSALRWREALEAARALTAGEHARADDLWARSRAAASVGDLEDARASAARAETAPLGPVEPFVRVSFSCDGTPPESEDEEPCSFREVARVDAPGEQPSAIAVVRLEVGSEVSFRILAGVNGRWMRTANLDALSRRADAVDALEISDLAIRQLEPAGPAELILRYRADLSREGGRSRESGFAVCVDLTSDSGRCAFVPESARDGTRVLGSASVVFGDDATYTVRRARGLELADGVHPLRSLFDPPS